MIRSERETCGGSVEATMAADKVTAGRWLLEATSAARWSERARGWGGGGGPSARAGGAGSYYNTGTWYNRPCTVWDNHKLI